MSEIDDDGDNIELRTGREGPAFTEVHDWVALSGVTPTAGFLYNLLRMHVNRTRGDKYVWLSTLTLAVLCKLSRGDKLKPYLDELEVLGAIDVERGGLHRRNIYTVHSLPPSSHLGPLDIRNWHKQNKPKLDSIRAAEKAVRDARRAKARAAKGQVNPVTPGRGEQPVTPLGGEPVTPLGGEPVTPSTGREPKEEQPKEVEPSVPPSEVRPPVVKNGGTSTAKPPPAEDEAVQPTLNGEVADPSEREITNMAMGIARDWIEGWEKPRPDGTQLKILMDRRKGSPQHAIANAIKFAVREKVSDLDIKRAMAWANMDIPDANQLRRGLTQVQLGWKPAKDWRPGQPHSNGKYVTGDNGQSSRGRSGRWGPVVDVNEAWADKVPARAATGGGR